MFSPRFIISQNILKNITAIEVSKEIINTAPLIPAWEKEFQSLAQVRTIHYGTHLEGNDLTLEQAQKVIKGEQVIARDRDVLEVINYRNVLKYIEKIGKEKLPDTVFTYTENILKKMHALTEEKILDKTACGVYRKAKVVIKDSATGEVVFSPIPAMEIPFQIADFFYWLNSPYGRQVHPVLRAGIAHFELARIHPFVDGNGRVARAFATLVLFLENYDIKKFFSLEEHFDKDPLSYYQALSSVSFHDNLTTWLEYFTQALAIELSQVKEKVQRLSLDLSFKDKLGRQIALTERQIKLMEYLKVHQKLLMSEAKKILPNVSEDTILRDFKDLMQKNIVRKMGKTKASTYVLSR